MELEQFKSAWRKRPVEGHVSHSVQFARTSAIRDLQRSEELSRMVFCLLFALLGVGVSFAVLPAGASRIACLLLAVALLADGFTAAAFLSPRLRTAAGSSMIEFVSRERRQIGKRLRFERYTQWAILVLTAVAVLLLLLMGPRPAGMRENAIDTLERMAVMTAFLAFAWRSARIYSKQIRRQLDGYLKDLETQYR